MHLRFTDEELSTLLEMISLAAEVASLNRKPGAEALPDSPGEAISRFRRDVFELPLFALWMNNLAGELVLAVVALAVMLSIDLWITVVALAPFCVVAVLAYAATERIDRYRRLSRRWAGIVCGYIEQIVGRAGMTAGSVKRLALYHARPTLESNPG